MSDAVVQPLFPSPGREGATVRLAEVISALTYALDLTEGQRPGHTLRTTLIALRLSEDLGLDAESRAALYYASLLKDSGCSSNAARMSALFGSDDQALKRSMRLVDWHDRWRLAMRTAKSCGIGLDPLSRIKHFLQVARTPSLTREIIQTRCERGAQIAHVLGFPTATGEAILHVDEHWCGLGHPVGLAGNDIPLLSRILLLAQTFEAYWIEHGVRGATEMARARRGTWFDPALVDRLLSWKSDQVWWDRLTDIVHLEQQVIALEPGLTPMVATPERLDRIAFAFAAVIDAKTPYTARHSTNVARYAVRIMGALGADAQTSRDVLRAGLLHDIGKLAVPSELLNKPSSLSPIEFALVETHSAAGAEILKPINFPWNIPLFVHQHHERLDGSGYPDGLKGAAISLEARIIGVADTMEEALHEISIHSGIKYDEQVVAACVRLFLEKSFKFPDTTALLN